jgi:SAM-dependent methyltransferase
MSESESKWEQLYQGGFKPWDTGRPDSHLVSVVRERGLYAGGALEIGCGTGTNAIWLAQQGLTVTAIDVSATALALARAKPGAERCTFVQGDFLDLPAPAEPFTFVFDLGCFHIFDAPAERSRFAKRVFDFLAPHGLWLCVSGSADGPQVGPPGRSALDIVLAAEPYFAILALTATALDLPSAADLADMHLPTAIEFRGWSCLMRRRPTAR